MKKICQVISILGMMLLFNEVVFAETGSLKINVDVSTPIELKEQTFFEQDVTLKQLFDTSLSQTIAKQQAEESLSNNQDKALLFLTNTPQKLNVIDTGQIFLSRPIQERQVTLRTDGTKLDLLSVVLIIVGLLFCGVSIYQTIKKRKEHHAS